MNDLMRGLWMKSFCFIAAVLSILAYEEIDAKMKESTFKLPKTVGLWTRADSPKIVDASNIFDYMNGGL